ncbi:MAG: rod shape-determining protein RodA [Lachnospiraceae bacterium]|nr:rod shape-determining protein RodA [Lachnospiraceae bacterium]
MFTKFHLRDYNFKLLIYVIAIMIIGVFAVNSADSEFTFKQAVGVSAGIVIMIFLSFFDYHFICKFYHVIYIVNIALLLMVLLFGVNVNNATRWINIGGENGIQIQPSEISKILMIVFVAAFLGKYKDKDRINTFRCIALFMVFVGFSLLFIVAEPDLSTTICLFVVLITMLYVSGLSYKIIGIALLIAIPLAGSFLWYIQLPGEKILLKQYQINRILSFVYPSQYGDDMSQQNNSIMAIGSGQLTGKGFNSSTIATVKDANFISEQQTDFIFSVIGEELGFIGSVIIIAIIMLIVLQCIKIARRAKDTRGMLIASGIGTLIAYQSFINIGVATGVLPNTGIPLPFISYGLSSLLSISIGMGIVLNVSLQKSEFY